METLFGNEEVEVIQKEPLKFEYMKPFITNINANQPKIIFE